MISFENVTKSYPIPGGRRQVLSNLSFTINRGQSIGIMGRNGAGKTTLTKLIGGVEYPTSGRIRRGMTVSWPLGLFGGFQFSLTGADNARFIARVYGLPIKGLLDFIDDFAELGSYLHMPVKTYSAGMVARLSFAVSLAMKFDCYLIDEITAVGDSRFRARCEDALRERREQGSLIMISHEIRTLRMHCQSGAIMQDGQLTFYDDLEEAITAYEALMQ